MGVADGRRVGVRVLVGVIVLVGVGVLVVVGVVVFTINLVGVGVLVGSIVGFEQAVSVIIRSTTRIDFFTIEFSPRIIVNIY